MNGLARALEGADRAAIDAAISRIAPRVKENVAFLDSCWLVPVLFIRYLLF